MKRLTILLISLLFIISAAKAQPPGVDPFYDAVPYSVKKFNKTFLTNQDAGVVRSFFEHQVKNTPIRVIQIDQGHHHGYRFCTILMPRTIRMARRHGYRFLLLMLVKVLSFLKRAILLYLKRHSSV